MQKLRVANHIPKRGSKAYRLLDLLLNGRVVDPQVAFLELNMPTIQARVSELRKLGWPVQSYEMPHPKLVGEMMVVYSFDAHFRGWIIENPGKHPGAYPHKEGRGRFANWTVTQFIEHAKGGK